MLQKTIATLLILSVYSAPLEQLVTDGDVTQNDVCTEKQGLRCGANMEAIFDEMKNADSVLISKLCLRLKDCTVEQKECAQLKFVEVFEVNSECNAREETTEPSVTSTASVTTIAVETVTTTASLTTTTIPTDIWTMEPETDAPLSTETTTVGTTQTTEEVQTTTEIPWPTTTVGSTTAGSTTAVPTNPTPEPTTRATPEVTFTPETSTSGLPQTTPDVFTAPPATPEVITTTAEPTLSYLSLPCQQSLNQSGPIDQKNANILNVVFSVFNRNDIDRQTKCVFFNTGISIQTSLDTVRRVCESEEANKLAYVVNLIRQLLVCDEFTNNTIVYTH